MLCLWLISISMRCLHYNSAPCSFFNRSISWYNFFNASICSLSCLFEIRNLTTELRITSIFNCTLILTLICLIAVVHVWREEQCLGEVGYNSSSSLRSICQWHRGKLCQINASLSIENIDGIWHWLDLWLSILSHLVIGSFHGFWRHLAPCHSSLRSCAAGPAGPGRDTAQSALRSGPAAGIQRWHRGAGQTHEVLQRGLQHPWKVSYLIIFTNIRLFEFWTKLLCTLSVQL